jgi:PAS domain S-box-containing protein
VHILPPEPSGVFRHAGGNVFVEDFNPAFAVRFGIDARESRGVSVKELLPVDAAMTVIRACRRCLGSQRTVKVSVPSSNAEGITRYVGLTLKQIAEDSVLATIPETVVFGRRQSDRQMLETLGGVEGGTIYVLDMRTHAVLYATEKVEELIGHTRDSIEGLIVNPTLPSSDFFQALFHPDDAVAVAAWLTDMRAARNDAVFTLICRVRHASNGWRWVETRARVLARDRNGEVERVVGVAVDITERRQLTADLRATSFALLRAEENERRRIAREIHDSTAQHLVALDLGFARLEHIPLDDAAARREWMEDMRSLTRKAHQELRVATFALHPPELERSGLADTLRDLVRGFGRRTGLVTDFQIEGVPRPGTQVAEHALLRVSQEALLNIHKHARARVAKLRLRYSEADIVIEIEDDGVGADSMEAGVGLQSMKARLAALGGVLSIVSSGTGFLVRASVRQDC